MQFSTSDNPAADATTLLVVGVTGTDDDRAVSGDAGSLDVDLSATLAALEFTPELGRTVRVARPGGGAVLVVGLGEDVDVAGVRRLGHAAGAAAIDKDAVALLLPAVDDVAAASQALAEGVVLGAYRFASYKQDTDPAALDEVTVHGGADADALRVGEVVARNQTVARDLVNTPPNDKRPPMLAARARELAEAVGVEVVVHDGDALREGGYGGLLAVGQGSEVDPQLVELRWAPDGADGDHVALVGKGITFDTGGISLKPSSSMETMKMDMGGAAVALATVLAVAELELPVRVTGLLCLAENMPSGTAQRVSDVYTALGGTTVEVMNTDAEGRLVLADGIVHAGEAGVDVIVDIATLTGAAVVALGDRYSVLLTEDDELAAGLRAAGDAAAERIWQLPVAVEEYKEKLDSEVADIKNVGGREAGTITAGLFLHHFVPDGVRWAHLDIAGTAWNDRSHPLAGKGATGVPVRTLVAWLRAGTAG